MARFFLLPLLMLTLASCQSETGGNSTESSSVAQLTAYQDGYEENGASTDTANEEKGASSPVENAGATAPPSTNMPTEIKKSETFNIPAPGEQAGSVEDISTSTEAAFEKAPSPKGYTPGQQEEEQKTQKPETSATEPKPSKRSSVEPPVPVPAAPSHKTWDTLLQKHVSSSGKVNYKGLLADKAELQAYLDELAANPPGNSWSRNEKLAYWINAYNAFTVKLILDHYPVASIMEIHSGKAWSVKWIELGGATYSLDQIENDIIRPRFREPRIHFAVNCAARSCPPLLNRAYTAGNLGQYLEQQTRSFINDPKYNTIKPKAVEISRIFEWYASDFGNIVDYLNQYAETRINKGAKVSYREYDWSLNN